MGGMDGSGRGDVRNRTRGEHRANVAQKFVEELVGLKE
jgi:hypothetical protein